MFKQPYLSPKTRGAQCLSVNDWMDILPLVLSMYSYNTAIKKNELSSHTDMNVS